MSLPISEQELCVLFYSRRISRHINNTGAAYILLQLLYPYKAIVATQAAAHIWFITDRIYRLRKNREQLHKYYILVHEEHCKIVIATHLSYNEAGNIGRHCHPTEMFSPRLIPPITPVIADLC